jgi:FixJ family two-component response regulator
MELESTVFVVDDDAAIRDSLRWLIEATGQHVETYGSAQDFLHAYGQGRPGCLVLDVRMAGMSGLDLQKRLADYPLPVPIIFISGHANVPVAVRAMRAGAVDFFTKPFNNEALLDRLNQCLRDNLEAWRANASRKEIDLRLASLTPREHEVMERVIRGQANKVIAIELGVSIKTVEAHRAKVMEKMGAHSLAELLRMTLTPPPLRENPKLT